MPSPGESAPAEVNFPPAGPNARSLRLQIALLTASRLVVNTGIRMIFPFLPIFARGMQVEMSQLLAAVSISSFSSAAAPFLAPLAERKSRRAAMLVGMALFAAGALPLWFFPSLPMFALSILLINLGDNLFTPAMQAYVSDNVPYNRRGAALAIVEMSWALSFVVCIPLLAWVMEGFGWRSILVVLFLSSCLVIALLLRRIPHTQPSAASQAALFSSLWAVIKSPPAIAGLAISFLLITGEAAVALLFGDVLEKSLLFSVGIIGLTSSAVGLAELGGEGLTALLSDRLGKKRSVAVGLGLNALVSAAFPLFHRSAAGTVIWFLLYFLTFEFSIVSLLPILSQILPQARATLMAFNMVSFSFGMALGGLLASLLYDLGFWANTLLVAALDLIGLFLLRSVKLKEEA